MFIVHLFSFVLIIVFVHCKQCSLYSVFVVHNYYNILSFFNFAISIVAVAVVVVVVAKSNLLSANFFHSQTAEDSDSCVYKLP